MVDNSSLSSIVLTYKGKILLFSLDLDQNGVQQDAWSFIGVKKVNDETFKEAICKKVKSITKLSLDSVELLNSSGFNNKKKHLYHKQLTDENVNKMERREGQRLQFFTLRELEKIALGEQTGMLLQEYKDEVKNLLSY